MQLRPLDRPQLDLLHVCEMYGRFLACCQAELEANFLLGDFDHWHFRHNKVITPQLQEVCEFDASKVLDARVAAAGLMHGKQPEELVQQIRFTRDFCQENKARLETADAEVRWLEQSGLSPAEYLQELEKAPDEGIVLVKHPV